MRKFVILFLTITIVLSAGGLFFAGQQDGNSEQREEVVKKFFFSACDIASRIEDPKTAGLTGQILLFFLQNARQEESKLQIMPLLESDLEEEELFNLYIEEHLFKYYAVPEEGYSLIVMKPLPVSGFWKGVVFLRALFLAMVDAGPGSENITSSQLKAMSDVYIREILSEIGSTSYIKALADEMTYLRNHGFEPSGKYNQLLDDAFGIPVSGFEKSLRQQELASHAYDLLTNYGDKEIKEKSKL